MANTYSRLLWKLCLLFISMEITTDRNSRILSYKKLFFNIACSYALSPETACPSRIWFVFCVTTAKTHHPPPHCANTHWFISINIQQVSINDCGCHFFLNEGIQQHTFGSYTLPSFCQTAPLLPSVTQQQNVMEYWQVGSNSTATPPTSASDAVDTHNKMRGITIGVDLSLASWSL